MTKICNNFLCIYKKKIEIFFKEDHWIYSSKKRKIQMSNNHMNSFPMHYFSFLIH